jgi:hypothetical protein
MTRSRRVPPLILCAAQDLVKLKRTDQRMTVEELRHELKLDPESEVRFPWATDASVPLEDVVAWLQSFQETGGVTAIRARFLSARLILRMASIDSKGIQ